MGTVLLKKVFLRALKSLVWIRSTDPNQRVPLVLFTIFINVLHMGGGKKVMGAQKGPL